MDRELMRSRISEIMKTHNNLNLKDYQNFISEFNIYSSKIFRDQSVFNEYKQDLVSIADKNK